MRTILVLYLHWFMNMSDNTSTAIYHAFTVVAYFFPLLGALIADSWLGKYRTILYLSVVYAIGMILNTLGAVATIGNLATHMALSFTGLFVIAIGTGGIKPCVSTFGGDQFSADQRRQRESFFSLFYFSINAGSLLSTVLSPILREDVHCFGRNDCYPLAFGLPAALMIVALITFAIGTPYYVIKPPEGNVLVEVFKGIKSAIVHRWRTPKSQRNKDHWLDYALVDTSRKLVRDTKYVLRVLILFIPLPFFWSLFDQQGSRWTLQATRMNGYIGKLRIKPDQMQVMNPLFIIILIPLFEVTIYKWTRNYNFTALKRMALGMVFAAVAFMIAAFVQFRIQTTMTPVPEISSHASLRIINAADCPLNVTSNIYSHWSKEKGGLQLKPGQGSNTLSLFVDSKKIGKNIAISYQCQNDHVLYNASVKLTPKSTWNIVISPKGTSLNHKVFKGIHEKSKFGGAIIRIFNALEREIEVEGLPKKVCNVTANNISNVWDGDRGRYHVKIYESDSHTLLTKYEAELDTGGIYTMLVMDTAPFPNASKTERAYSTLFVDVKPNDVSLFLMIPQYFVITVGEILLSVTGLEFSFSQAPTSMRSVLASFWLLTVSVGNLITLIIAESKAVANQAAEYILFAGLMGIATIIFIFLARRYQYVDENEFYETENDPLGVVAETDADTDE